eukprot:7318119-Prymnesium_polylepis.1
MSRLAFVTYSESSKSCCARHQASPSRCSQGGTRSKHRLFVLGPPRVTTKCRSSSARHATRRSSGPRWRRTRKRAAVAGSCRAWTATKSLRVTTTGTTRRA